MTANTQYPNKTIIEKLQHLVFKWEITKWKSHDFGLGMCNCVGDLRSVIKQEATSLDTESSGNDQQQAKMLATELAKCYDLLFRFSVDGVLIGTEEQLVDSVRGALWDYCKNNNTKLGDLFPNK